MIAPAVSSFVLSQSVRGSVQQLQTELLRAQTEVASGRHADIGLALGSRAADAVALREVHASLATLRDTNAQAGVRLEASQAVLKGAVETAQGFIKSLLAARGNAGARQTLVDAAKGNLAELVAGANAQVGGVYLFGGVNAGAPPLQAYDALPASAAKQAVDSAFITAFGTAQGAPGTASIGAAAIQGFLGGPYAALFEDAAWQATWSVASDMPLASRIAPGQTAQTSATANDPAFRALASLYTMVADLGGATLNEDAFRALTDAAVALGGTAVERLAQTAARLGTSQERIAVANTRIDAQLVLVGGRSDTLEGVDSYAASAHLTALQTQLETAYSLTARLQGLSLLDFLQR